MAINPRQVTTLDHGAAAMGFDYSQVSPEHVRSLQKTAREIRKELVSVSVGMCAVGRKLVEARPMLRHGTWLAWLVSETGMSQSWARGCIAMHERFGSAPTLLPELDVAMTPTAILRLATASDSAFDEVLGKARGGERLTVSDVEYVIRQHREPLQRAGSVERSQAGGRSTEPAPSLQDLAAQARDELIAEVLERLESALLIFEEAEREAAGSGRVNKSRMESMLRTEAQWLTDALQQLTQRAASSHVAPVHRTFLSRRPYEPGPWADVAALLTDIARSDAWGNIPAQEMPAFVRKGAAALSAVLRR